MHSLRATFGNNINFLILQVTQSSKASYQLSATSRQQQVKCVVFYIAAQTIAMKALHHFEQLKAS